MKVIAGSRGIHFRVIYSHLYTSLTSFPSYYWRAWIYILEPVQQNTLGFNSRGW